ncbi:phosphotransferase [Curtobacterium ammoniigenes]|uniref:phosphotransferase n=1 Tax=Curtobacterium ammoniigenes TaxID=395387 RepID=UPI00082BBC59|nr:phosphotransferase [Curtobacterium ammoniigenes]
MAGSQFTLAALATTAVPELVVTGAGVLGSVRDGDYESALLQHADGALSVIRRPRSQRAEARQSADLVAIRALSAGIRTRLPFAVPEYIGQAPIGSTRAIVTTFVDGDHLDPRALPTSPTLAASIGAAVAAIHGLPTSFVSDAGLPSLTPFEILRGAVTTMDRAVATQLVPAALQQRWEHAARDQQLWQFTPTVVHGSLDASSLLVRGGTVSGVLGWGDLRLGDPAKDLAWVLGIRDDRTTSAVFAAYTSNGGGRDRQLGQRARLYHELETAGWLLHGVQVKRTEIVDDAVAMMQRLAAVVDADAATPIEAEHVHTMEIREVEELLSTTERRHG